MNAETYTKRIFRTSDIGSTTATVLGARWFLPNGYYVQAYTKSGRVRGFLTDRGGFGGHHIAQRFDSAQAASDAAFAVNCYSFDVRLNTNPSK